MNTGMLQKKSYHLIVLSAFITVFLIACNKQIDSPSLTGDDWHWVGVANVETEIEYTVDDPQNYVLRFNEDGSLAVEANGNIVTGYYTRSGTNIGIELDPSLLFWGEEDDLDLKFFGYLNGKMEFKLQNDLLVLALSSSSHQLLFSK